MGEFILADFSRDSKTGEMINPLINKYMHKWLGNAIVACPFEAHTAIDFTGPPGSTSGLFYSLFFQLGKWEYYAQKADEWIEVSPVHAQYYQLTQKQKEDLETRIKAGLASASQAVADMELVMHDERKYREFLEYLGYRTKRQITEEAKAKEPEVLPDDYDELYLDEEPGKVEKRADNHSLKAVFIDQVDVHTGDGISMRSVVSRWPTLISDFMRLGDKDMDVENVMKKLDTSRAEAVVLITKNKLFAEWKKLFCREIISRYKRIRDLVRSRGTSVDQYREWLKPAIARHKMLKEGLESEDRRAARLLSPINVPGYATSSAVIELWAWKDFTPMEIFKAGSEDVAKLVAGHEKQMKLSPYDRWTKKNLIFNKEHGLINVYPWITDKWVQEKLKEFYNTGWLTKTKFYYSFFIITLSRTNMRDPTGSELEDGVFDVNLVVMSQNVLFTKLLELKARQEELEMHINKLLGMPHKISRDEKKWKPEKEYFSGVNKFLDRLSLGLSFSYRGKYEKNFWDRLTNLYYSGIVGTRYNAIINFIKAKTGMGR